MSFYSNGVSGNYLSHADLTDARFSRAAAWTYLIFFKITNTAADESVLTAKGSNLFYLRTDAATSPTRVEMKIHNDWFTATSNDVYQDVWYLVAVRCDGSGNITLGLYDVDTSLIDEQTEARASDHTTENGNDITISRAGSADLLRGHVAYSCYVKQYVSGGDIGAYISNPDGKVASWGSDVVWYLTMVTSDAADLGDDSSGNGNHFTVNGSPTASEDNPEITPTGTAIDATVNGGSTAAALVDAELSIVAVAPGTGAASTFPRFIAGASATGAASSGSTARQNKEQGWTVAAPTEGQARGRMLALRSFSAAAETVTRSSIWGHLDKGITFRSPGVGLASVHINADLSLRGPGASNPVNWAALLTARGYLAVAPGTSAAAAASQAAYGLSGATVAYAGTSVPLRLLLSAAATAPGLTAATARIVVGELAARAAGQTLGLAYLNQVFSLAVLSPGVSTITAVPRLLSGLIADNDGSAQFLLQLLLQRPLIGGADGVGDRIVRASVEYTLIGTLRGNGAQGARLQPDRGLISAQPGAGLAAALALALRGSVARSPGVGLAVAYSTALRQMAATVEGRGEVSALAALLLGIVADVAPVTVAPGHLSLIAALASHADGIATQAHLLSILRPLIGRADGAGLAAVALAELVTLLAAADGISESAAGVAALREVIASVHGSSQGVAAGTILNPLIAAAAGVGQAQSAAGALRNIIADAHGSGIGIGIAAAERALIAAGVGVGSSEVGLAAGRGWIVVADALAQNSAGINLDLALAGSASGNGDGDTWLVANRLLAAAGVGSGEQLGLMRLHMGLDAHGGGQGLGVAGASAQRRLLGAAAGQGLASASARRLLRLVGQPRSQGDADLLLNLILAVTLLAAGRTRVDGAAAEIEDANYYTQGQIYG